MRGNRLDEERVCYVIVPAFDPIVHCTLYLVECLVKYGPSCKEELFWYLNCIQDEILVWFNLPYKLHVMYQILRASLEDGED